MKKIFAAVLAAAMIISFAGCSDNKLPEVTTASTTAQQTATTDNTTAPVTTVPDSTSDATTSVTDETTAPSTDSTTDKTAEVTTPATTDKTTEKTTDKTTDKTTEKTTAKTTVTTKKTTVTTVTTAKPLPSGDGRTAAEIAADMTIGWNLGNSLDAVGSGLNSETAWGNPKIAKELVDAVKAAGFDTIRLPITWMGHFDENYTIDEAWLNRVQEVVDYIIDNDMYCIINIHHDGNDTSSSWLTPVPTNEDAMVNQFTTLWKQIAKKFKNYDDRLLFAGMNEFHKGYGNATSEYLRITNRLNQAFVTTVRATGGANANRILVVQCYNTNAQAGIKGLVIPTDTVADKIMVEFHFYDPWNFAGSGKGTWGNGGTNNDSWGQEDWVNNIFGKLKTTFIDKGVPVIMGEYGAVINKDGYSDTRRYYIEYVTKAASENGIIPIWWDNGYNGSSGEAFALFSRTSYNILHQDIVDALMRAVSGKKYTITVPTY